MRSAPAPPRLDAKLRTDPGVRHPAGGGHLGLHPKAADLRVRHVRDEIDPPLDGPSVQQPHADRLAHGDQAEVLGIPVAESVSVLQTSLGPSCVNDFTLFRKVYRVIIHTGARDRDAVEDIARRYGRSAAGDMIPLCTLLADGSGFQAVEDRFARLGNALRIDRGLHFPRRPAPLRLCPRLMARDVSQPHDKLFRAVFSDPVEAAGFLRAYLPESLGRGLRWSTLRLQPGRYVDEELRGSESDLLFAVEHEASPRPVSLYLLFEHQSSPDRWLRLRLLKYCCRIWERDRCERPQERELRPVVPLVFYQGARQWRHAAEFSELFPASARQWRWLPRFEHLLLDQSRMTPEEVRGELRGRVAQLAMMAAAGSHGHEALERMAELLARLPGQGVDALSLFVVYVLDAHEEDEEAVRVFRQALRRHVHGAGGDLMSYAEKLREEGRQKGRQEGQLGTIESLLRVGVEWPAIEAATGLDREAFRALRRRVEEAEPGTAGEHVPIRR